jgi:outer membrane protein OmpA-like peptidoglycan-associated protein
MQHTARIRLASLCLVAALGAAGCTTKVVQPTLSQAVIDARARRNAPPPPACTADPVTTVSPVTVGFAFNDDELTQAMGQQLDRPAKWLACRPAVPAVIRPDADGHGSPAEQDALARRRAEQVRAYLVAQGVPAQRIQILGRAGTEPKGEIVLIRAEGRRW